ncbi:hypothetical protein DIS24_g9230 [Lasiodiplodia hormozganensis]|uniref:Uncharacterized protein n=1 Tax=Lasiodiplodia hormozganensis TaxID=869390 RepID=A0AA39XXS3_9PEZI|nr:hypothetical protein DIS24_g9230 [Lasiodiplodia hormozganensis]
MVLDGGVITIPAAISLINLLFHVFKRISKWLKRRANTLWKEDHRILKIVKDYCSRNSNPNTKLPDYIQVLVRRLEVRKLQWMDAPEAAAAEREAKATERYQDPGYTTDFEDSDVGSGTDDDKETDEEDDDSNIDEDEEEDDDDHIDDDSEDDDEDDGDDDDEEDEEEDSDNYAGSYDSDDSDANYDSDDS